MSEERGAVGGAGDGAAPGTEPGAGDDNDRQDRCPNPGGRDHGEVSEDSFVPYMSFFIITKGFIRAVIVSVGICLDLPTIQKEGLKGRG